jgi:hypothetical protein
MPKTKSLRDIIPMPHLPFKVWLAGSIRDWHPAAYDLFNCPKCGAPLVATDNYLACYWNGHTKLLCQSEIENSIMRLTERHYGDSEIAHSSRCGKLLTLYKQWLEEL